MAISRYTTTSLTNNVKAKQPSGTMRALETLKSLDDEDLPALSPIPKTAQAREAPAAPPSTSGSYDPEDSDLDGIISLAEKQAAERRASQDDLAKSKAEQLQQAQAKANLGGMGLSGAAASQQASITRQADRTSVETQADLRQKQSDEAFQQQQRLAAIWEQELADGVDLDGDKYVGPPPSMTGKTPDQYNNDRKEASRQEAASKFEANNAGEDLFYWDADNAPGSVERPYVANAAARKEMEAAGFDFKEKKVSGVDRVNGGWVDRQIYVDNDGHFWIFN
jgi:hypothetical protein